MKFFKLSSIQARLIVVFGAIALVGSCTAGWMLFRVLNYEVRHQEIAEVSGKIELIQHLARLQDASQDLPAFYRSIDNLLGGHEHLKAWIIDPSGASVYGGALPQIQPSTSEGEYRVMTPADDAMRGMTSAFAAGALTDYRLIVATDTVTGDRLLYAFGTALMVICAIWVVGVSIFAAWAVRRSMSAIGRLSEQAARIRPDDLSVRLPVESIDRELRELSLAFNKTLDRVQGAYRQMEGFNADVAHELRTPLATLISGSEIALSRSRSAEELREVVSSNLEELEAMQLMVNDMLFLARADRGEPALDRAVISVRDEVAIVLDYYEAMLDSANISVQVVGAARATASPRLMRRAISNLVSNAIKATPSGQNISIWIRCESNTVQVEVRNPGDGIAQDMLGKIFDRFYRGDSARADRPEGHGLGLAIVRAIARMHGGDTFARSGASWSEVGFSIQREPDNAGLSSGA
ncbi:heavy metal sensor histidine kinase [Schauerella aestuarii]|uniref:heavy metal sensor histidine kinase n=1 Tax=Schauerella aestuarii TaxID=2511204 RepID=UPI001369AC0E|nr:heavy metal sensor histidine kinase [Achromobacter aestuarii]MYZ42536.1 heavy metal sensor histidine kinase [Achromobacter aestuarii]